MPLVEYEVTWNGAPLPVDQAIRKIRVGEYPDDLVMYHNRFGTITVARSQFGDSPYSVSRTGPSPFGRGGLARANAVAPLSEEGLLSYIDETFPEVAREIAIKNSAEGKLLRLQVEASKKAANQFEATHGKKIPQGIKNEIGQFLGNKAPVPGAYSVLENLSKISTNLFQGGKRKSKKSRKSIKRKQRKITRRRR